MDRRWLPLNALRAFEAAGRNRSFTAAAQSLLVTQSAVSRHVIGLEDLLGVALFERRPHQLVLTEAGRRLLPVVTRSLDRIDEALDDVRTEKGKLRRSLRISLPHSFAHQLAIPMLRDFRDEYPDIGLEIDTRPTSATVERPPDLAVIYTEPAVTDRVLNLLWMVRLTILCHPDVAARAAGGEIGAFLSGNDLLHVAQDDRPNSYFWQLFTLHAGCRDVKVDGGLVFNTAQMAVAYARSGAGLALVDPLLFAAEVASGALVAPFDIRIDDGFGYYVATDSDDLFDPAVAVFRSWIIRRFSGLGASGQPIRDQ